MKVYERTLCSRARMCLYAFKHNALCMYVCGVMGGIGVGGVYRDVLCVKAHEASILSYLVLYSTVAAAKL